MQNITKINNKRKETIKKDMKKASFLKKEIEKLFMIKDLNVQIRVREIFYLRIIYYQIGHRVNKISINSLSKVLNQTHASGSNSLKKHENEMNGGSIYKYLYFECLNKLGLVDKNKEFILDDRLNDTIKELLSLNNNDFEQICKYKIEPALKMIKSKVTNEDLINNQKLTRTM